MAAVIDNVTFLMLDEQKDIQIDGHGLTDRLTDLSGVMGCLGD